MVPTAEVRLLSQQGMVYCFIYHGQLFLPGFIPLTESSSCVPGAINCNKENMTIMSSFIQYYDHKVSDVLLSILGCDKFDRRGAKGNIEHWYCGLCGNWYNIWNSAKASMHMTRSGDHIIAWCRGEILSKYQRQFKALKEKKLLFRNQRVSKSDMLQTSVHSGAEAISTDFISRKRRKVSGTSSS